MPELPEVETIAGYLRQGRDSGPPIVGKVIASSQLFWQRTLASPSPAEFATRIKGQTVLGAGRRGKYLILYLSQDTLLIHLRMSGDIRLEPAKQPTAPHDRLLIEFRDEWRLAFNDPRKFGRVWLVADPESVLGALGPEPLDEQGLPWEDFYRRVTARRRQLKPLLIDQSFLAGLGNIYADEALHLAHLHPLALSDRLTPAQAERLLRSIRQVLTEGIRRQGASIDWVYRGGDFQNYFRVYRRTGLACPECGTLIVHLMVGQRSTHICPECQKLES